MTNVVELPTDLAMLRRLIAARPQGTAVTVESFRTEIDAAQIPGQRLGPLFNTAVKRGWLSTDGRTVPSNHPSARGRRILIYTTQIARAA